MIYYFSIFNSFFPQAAFGLNLNIIMDENDLFLQSTDKILAGFQFKIRNPFLKVNTFENFG